jgi:hypothetical protein
MPDDWTKKELNAATRTYLWLLRSETNGYKVNKTNVRKALLAGPLSSRNDSSVEFRFQNISAVLADMGRDWVTGYRPAKNVGPNIRPRIEAAIKEYEEGAKHAKRVSWLAKAIPLEAVSKATQDLAEGASFDFEDSTTYDVVLDRGTVLAPKAVVGYAALLHFGAPLLAQDFVGGEGTVGFERIRAAGFQIGMKAAPDSDEFRKAVREAKKKKFSTPPVGRKNPPKVETTSKDYSRLPSVVAYVEERANGFCERCESPAPFLRPDGDPYLEVHHIQPLSEGGADSVENSAGLCPNCHRECHSGVNVTGIRDFLSFRIAKIQAALFTGQMIP